MSDLPVKYENFIGLPLSSRRGKIEAFTNFAIAGFKNNQIFNN